MSDRKENPTWILPAVLIGALAVAGCTVDVSPIGDEEEEETAAAAVRSEAIPDADFVLGDKNTHNKFSSTIPPVRILPNGPANSLNWDRRLIMY